MRKYKFIYPLIDFFNPFDPSEKLPWISSIVFVLIHPNHYEFYLICIWYGVILLANVCDITKRARLYEK